jgi:hypothetical protein
VKVLGVALRAAADIEILDIASHTSEQGGRHRQNE